MGKFPARLALIYIACAASLVLDCVNWRSVFPGAGQVYFADPDCYARMTRVREVFEHPGVIVRMHYFENYPFGVRSHTTAPLDYLTAALAWILRPIFHERALDLAGAWISPLLGVLTVAGLGWRFGDWAMLTVLAASPVLGQAFALGRPDHQSLLVALLAGALASELSGSRRAKILGAIAWGVALWVSIYEPAVLFVCAVAINPRRWERLITVAVALVALAIEGWRFTSPSGEYFERWAAGGQISELRSLPPWSWVIYSWVGFGILVAPWLLWRRKSLVGALILTFALTCWQMRWGYFLALVYAITLPFQVPRRRWLLLFAMIPLFLAPRIAFNADETREDNRELREAADFIRRESGEGSILAPWWQSPALAYWSGKPAVAGSSHESLPGIVDVARFYLSEDGAAVLEARHVRWIIAYEPERVLYTAASLLDQKTATARVMGALLYQHPELAGPGLRLAFVNRFFRVYER